MDRTLGSFEQALAISHEAANQTFVNVIRLSSAPDPQRLRRSLDDLQRKTPILQVSLGKRGTRFVFQPAPGRQIRLVEITREDDQHWIEVVERELHRSFPTGLGPLVEVILLTPGSSGIACELVVTWHHAIMDGESAAAFLHVLLEACCGAVVSPTGPIETGTTLLPASDAFFPPPFKGVGLTIRMLPFLLRMLAGELGYFLRRRGSRVPEVHPEAKPNIQLLRLDEATTTAFVKRARKEGVTLNSALSAVMMLATWYQLYASEPGPYRGISFANLRPYLVPPVPPQAMGAYLSMLRYTVTLREGQDFWDTARVIHDRIYKSAKRGEKFLMARASKDVMSMAFRTMAARMATIAISYVGPFQLEQNYGGIDLLDVHAFSSNFGIGPELTGTAYLYQGGIQLDMIYLDTDMTPETARQISNKISSSIRETITD